MFSEFTTVLWLLKLGALLNLYFLAQTFGLGSGSIDAHIVLPAQILFAVSAYRCLFPCRYQDHIVFHDTPFSSIFVTRFLAMFAEVAYIYQFSHVIRVLNVEHVGWVDALSWWMVAQVVISQFFVWGAILTGRLALYFYEEIGWAIIFVANTVTSAYLYSAGSTVNGGETLLQLNLAFGLVYLPWQFNHLRVLYMDAQANPEAAPPPNAQGESAGGFHDSLFVWNRRTDADSWGGFVGLTWMATYWATLIPPWLYYIVTVLSER